jgi:alpha-tubulin suppressor-like RCC1 family protein
MNTATAFHPTHTRRLFLAATFIALAGCGGGGDSSAPTPTPNPPAAAPTPPPPAPPPPAPATPVLPPTPVPVLPQVAAGSGISIALKTNGTVAAWGDQEVGQLGNNVISASSQGVPQTVMNLSNARRVAAGELHAVALRVDGTVVSWGSNADGKLGIGTLGGNFATPQVVNGLTNITAIAVGLNHSLALRNDGTVWVWGGNDQCELGLNDTTPRATATPVAGLANVTSIFSGGPHSLALRSDGAVFAWGRNDFGQLGLGSTSIPVCLPARVTALDGRGVVELASGVFHTLARTSLGAVLGWGMNTFGQTGTTPSGNVRVPTVVPGLLNVTALSAGQVHSVALLNDGTIRTWGSAFQGRLGNGTDTGSTSTPQAPNVSTVKAIAAGISHTLVLLQDGKVSCFGSAFRRQCGRIEDTDFTTPMEVGPGFNVNP